MEGNESPGVDVHQFQFSGSVTAKVLKGGEAIGSREDRLMAFVDDELRGEISGRYFGPTMEHVFPMMIFSNVEEGEEITFKYYSADQDVTYLCKESLSFSKDMVIADAFEAFELNLDQAVGIDGNLAEPMFRLDAYPNPFRHVLNIEVSVSEYTHVKLAIYDMVGNLVKILDEEDLTPGHHQMQWDAGTMPSGTYILKALIDDQQIIERVTLID